VYNRKRQLNASGQALVQVEAYCQGQKVYFSTHIYLSPSQWDGGRQRVRRHPNAVALTAHLRQFVAEMEQREMDFRLRGKAITPAQLKAAVCHPKSLSFYAFVEHILNKVSHRGSTLCNRLSTLHALKKFRPEVEWSALNYAFVDDFEHHLRASECQASTVAKHLKHLRLFINLSIRHGHLSEDGSPFRSYPIPAAHHTPVYLTEQELARMEGLLEADCPATYRMALEAYLFCCYTGIRYSDFTALQASNLTQEGDEAWLQFTTVKTGILVKIPLAHLFEGKALKIWARHQSHPEELFQLKSNGAVNKSLRWLAEQAGIRKHLTFHTARHTFATLLIYRGASITTVQKLLGHRRVTTTEHYGEVLPEGIVRDLERCWGRSE
jgi:site-specific recombinase XerD